MVPVFWVLMKLLFLITCLWQGFVRLSRDLISLLFLLFIEYSFVHAIVLKFKGLVSEHFLFLRVVEVLGGSSNSQSMGLIFITTSGDKLLWRMRNKGSIIVVEQLVLFRPVPL